MELEKIREFLTLGAAWDDRIVSLTEPDNRGFVVKHAIAYRGLRATAHVLTDRLRLGKTVSQLKRSRAMALFDAGQIGEEMTPVDRRYLEHYYAPDIARLEGEFGIDTTVWERARG